MHPLICFSFVSHPHQFRSHSCQKNRLSEGSKKQILASTRDMKVLNFSSFQVFLCWRFFTTKPCMIWIRGVLYANCVQSRRGFGRREEGGPESKSWMREVAKFAGIKHHVIIFVCNVWIQARDWIKRTMHEEPRKYWVSDWETCKDGKSLQDLHDIKS